MTKKSKGRKIVKESKAVVVAHDIPIPNLPDKFLWMHVNSGTKIRNVLNYALKEFPDHKSVVWSGAGQGIGKVITCAEICKKKNPGLYQMTKLRYIKSKKSEIAIDDNENRRVPEIHILLSKNPLDKNEPGYQSSIDQDGLFIEKRSSEKSSNKNSKFHNKLIKKEEQDKNEDNEKGQQEPSTSNKLSNIATEEFAAMGLRTGQKRSHKGQQTKDSNSSSKKSRKKGKN